MKKLIGVVLFGTILLSACENLNTESPKKANVKETLGRLEVVGIDNVADGPSGEITIFKDKETGCQYMYIGAASGPMLTPVLNQDGKPYCTQK
ncbi:DUF6440 family protein [Bacillus cereus]|uniref:DUF6440 family protein n=1 Tax=Bacillus cereus TaxID=1396 RepID=UPI000BFB3F30|nr:DUF6440 family protein [Bacillus cereus]PGU51837.1 hypothetical protein COD72_23105 [Bacillus cereus]